MIQAQTEIEITTRGQDLYNMTPQITDWLELQSTGDGLLTVFCRHTSASLTIQENADPDVLADLADFFGGLVKEDPRLYRHTMEGPDDMPAHIRTALTDTSLAVPVVSGRMALGTWQAIYLFEHRAHSHRRFVSLHYMGE